jgi:hypothetical protein
MRQLHKLCSVPRSAGATRAACLRVTGVPRCDSYNAACPLNTPPCTHMRGVPAAAHPVPRVHATPHSAPTSQCLRQSQQSKQHRQGGAVLVECDAAHGARCGTSWQGRGTHTTTHGAHTYESAHAHSCRRRRRTQNPHTPVGVLQPASQQPSDQIENLRVSGCPDTRRGSARRRHTQQAAATTACPHTRLAVRRGCIGRWWRLAQRPRIAREAVSSQHRCPCVCGSTAARASPRGLG